MEEKERYEYFFGTNTIKDNKTNQFYGCVVDLLNQQDKQIKDLQSQLAITEKALELACKEITGSCAYCSYKTRIECPVEADCLNEKINYFKSKAKEILENE